MSVKQRLHDVMERPPMKFQVTGVKFVEQHNGRAIIGDDMGLGKTYQSIAWLALHPEARPAVIVCPATMKLKWKRELRVFAGIRSSVLNGFKRYGVKLEMWEEEIGKGKSHSSVRWFGTMADRRRWLADNWDRVKVETKLERQSPHVHDVAIVNYDVLGDWVGHLPQPKVVIPDEAHKLKNQSAKRTKHFKKLAAGAPHVIPLTGTPMENRPSELYTILNLVAPTEFPSFVEYAFRYCNPKRGWRGRGWDFSGASHLDELHERLSRHMIRRMKADVLPDLPPKMRTIIPVEITNRKEYTLARDSFVEWLLAAKGPDAVKRAKSAATLVQLGDLKRLAAAGKMETVVAWIHDWLEDTDKKLVVFAIHDATITKLREAFPSALVITGTTPAHKRQGIIDAFQTDAHHRLIFGNIEALGVGSTLTAASDVAFVEMGWTPTGQEQAEDRVLRIGQLAKEMNAFYFIAEDTVDEKHFELLDTKRGIVGQVVDGRDTTGDVPVVTMLIEDLMRKGA